MHGTVGTLIAFLMAFRTSQSYTNYVDGRKILGGMCNNLREMAMNTYTFRADLEGEEGEEVASIRRNIRRQINVLYAVMRQHIREYQEGFGKKRQMVDRLLVYACIISFRPNAAALALPRHRPAIASTPTTLSPTLSQPVSS